MRWVILAAWIPLLHALGPTGFAWLATGGVLYTAGLIFYALESRFSHAHGV
jgi:hemolysin III